MPSLWNEGVARNWQQMAAACSASGTNWTLTMSRNRYNRSTDFSWQGWMREPCQGTPRVTWHHPKFNFSEAGSRGSQEFGKSHSQSERGTLPLSQLILSLNGRHLEANQECLEGAAKFLPISVISQKEESPSWFPGGNLVLECAVYQQHHLAALESLVSVKKKGREPKEQQLPLPTPGEEKGEGICSEGPRGH